MVPGAVAAASAAAAVEAVGVGRVRKVTRSGHKLTRAIRSSHPSLPVGVGRRLTVREVGAVAAATDPAGHPRLLYGLQIDSEWYRLRCGACWEKGKYKQIKV